ncbi:hypothetical protein RYZ26_19395 [Terasakiella sp. A23]|uniref:hypothetical protein n=1 Tax=Terasakiella sp. FCG-A23 TaxID=3080561 RepID=UPI002954F5A4|nr:hypothetical protein [Terasakiella sp. A23]MDV7341775.1 hypothetical protein [Terasakiella sp. A23]
MVAKLKTNVIEVDTISKQDGSPVDLTGLCPAKGFISFTMNPPTVKNSLNLSSFVDAGTGRPEMHHTNAYIGANYSATGGQHQSAFYGFFDTGFTATQITGQSYNYNGAAQDLDNGSMTFHGDLA